MYTGFYGLREKPFSLSPDPRFLFLADSHREALAHLLYGIEQGEGFIVVTGEVGMGKTTLCRTLLRRLGPEYEVAFLFNPEFSARELLLAIHVELGIESRGMTQRELVDELNRFLLTKRHEGRRVLLIVDEAQGLAPATLEQIRLLSNLETERAKLIQILLLGQPELDAMLESQALRQLRQRIGVRWRLSPLSRRETSEYVRHRLQVAGAGERELFTARALAQVYRRTGGVPRLVNLLCDRALLSGYALGERQVTGAGVARANRELTRGRPAAGLSPLRRLVPAAAFGTAVLLLAFVAGALAWRFADRGARPAPAALTRTSAPAGAVSHDASPRSDSDVAAPAVPVSPARDAEATADGSPAPPVGPAGSRASGSGAKAGVSPSADAQTASAPALGGLAGAPAAQDLGVTLALEPPGITAAASLRAILQAWKLQLPADAPELLPFPAVLDAITQRGLTVLPLRDTDLGTLRALDHPALLLLDAADGVPRVVALRRMAGDEALLFGVDPSHPVRVSLADLQARWHGQAYVVWRDFANLPDVLRPGDRGPAVLWLQRSLRKLGMYGAAPSGRFDAQTLAAVRRFQRLRRLDPDGAVGPRTKMALYGALARYAVPRLAPRSAERVG